MEIVLSRILKYMNGCLCKDVLYDISLFIVKHYGDMEFYSLDRLIIEGNFIKEDVLLFCERLGFHCYEDFHSTLLSDYELRVNQIRERMFGIKAETFFNKLDDDYDKKELKNVIESICYHIFKHKRIILVGALYPMSISVELQTDFITLGKEVIQYHHFMNDIELTEDDLVLFMSATGRTLTQFINSNKIQKNAGKIILITQNKKYIKDSLDTDYVVYIPGKFDGIEFNYQMMVLMDLLRIYYFQKYYL